MQSGAARPAGIPSARASNRLFLVVGFALALTVGAIAGLASEVVGAGGGALDTRRSQRRGDRDGDGHDHRRREAAPEAEAALEEEGVADPEAALTELLDDETEGQQKAITPSSERTETPGGS